MRNRYGHHHMVTTKEKEAFEKKYGKNADFSKPGSKRAVDDHTRLRELEEEVRKLKEQR